MKAIGNMQGVTEKDLFYYSLSDKLKINHFNRLINGMINFENINE